MTALWVRTTVSQASCEQAVLMTQGGLVVQNSPDLNWLAQVNDSRIRIIHATDSQADITLDLKEDLPTPQHLQSNKTQLHWMADSHKLLILPEQLPQQNFFGYFEIDLNKNEYHLLKVPLGPGVTLAKPLEGLYTQSDNFVWFPQTPYFGVRLDIEYGAWQKKRKEVLLLFNYDGTPLRMIGYENDEGYRLQSILQSKDNPFLFQFVYHHHTYVNLELRTWDFSSFNPPTKKTLYEEHKAPRFREILFEPSQELVRPTKDQFAKPHLVPSPDGSYSLSLTIDSSSREKRSFWALDILREIPSRADDTPFKWSHLVEIPNEIEFDEFTLYWFQRGRGLILNAGGGLVWIWNKDSNYLEVVAADRFFVINDRVYFLRLENESERIINVFDLLKWHHIQTTVEAPESN